MAVKARCTSSTTSAGMVSVSMGNSCGTTAARAALVASEPAFSLLSTSVMSWGVASSSVAAPAISMVASPTTDAPTSLANAESVVGIDRNPFRR